MPSFHYLAGSTVPSQTADSIHVLRMCDALSEEVEVTLFAKEGSNPSSTNEYYGVKNHFEKRLTKFSNRTKMIAYCLSLFRADRPSISFGRYVYALAFQSLRGGQIGYEIHAPADGIKQVVERYLFSRASLSVVVFITHALREHYCQKYPSLSKISIVLADAANDPGDVIPIERSGRLKIAYVGSWYAGRGVEMVVNLATQLSQFDFLIAGGQKEQLSADLRAAVDGSENIECVGYVPPARTAALIRGADVLLAPYQQVIRTHGNRGDTARWASPMKLFEYMSHGKVVLCSDLPVFREVLVDGENALLIDGDDISTWRQNLLDLDADRLQMQVLGDAARRRFLERHTWSGRARALLDHLNLRTTD